MKREKHGLHVFTLATVVSCCLAALAAAQTVPPSGVRKHLRVGLLPVVNKSKVGGETLAQDAFGLFVRAMQERKELTVVPLESIPEADPLSEYGPELNIEPKLLMEKLGDLDGIVRFVITQQGTYRTKKNDRDYWAVEIEGRVVSTTDGLLIGKTYSRGAEFADQKGKAPDHRRLLQSAVVDAVDQLVELLYIQGMVGVKGLGKAQTIVATVGTLDGIRPGAHFAFYDEENELIGFGKAIETDDAYTKVRLDRGSSFARVDIGTRLRPIFNPPAYAAGRTLTQLEEKSWKRDEARFGLAFALTLLGLEVYKNNFAGDGGEAGTVTPPPPPPPPPPS